MRYLLQPRVLKLASVAALISALACFPRLSLWYNRPAPIWYLEVTIFVCAVVLWSFVFAWHLPYAGRPAFVFRLKPGLFFATTIAGILVAAMCRVWLDPMIRSKFPEEFPDDLQHWLASVPFMLAFNQLFQVFAPFDWLVRLSRNFWVATILTALLGTVVLAMKIHSLAAPSPWLLTATLLASRTIVGFLSATVYLRGGIVLVWWWTFLIESRHLLNLI